MCTCMAKRKKRGIAGFKADDAIEPVVSLAIGLGVGVGADFAASKLTTPKEGEEEAMIKSEYADYARLGLAALAAVFTPKQYRSYGIAAAVGLAAAPLKNILKESGVISGLDNGNPQLGGIDNSSFRARLGYKEQPYIPTVVHQNTQTVTEEARVI